MSEPASSREPLRASAPADRAEERAVAFFGVWMMTGLFIDGWAHQADKPETFFSPWHGILYSGFVSAIIWFAWRGLRAGRGINPARGLGRLTAAGFVMFAGAGIADGIWHQVFGVEADLEALVSPSHLALFFGGFLMVSSPLRAGRERPLTETHGRRLTWADWFPQGITLTLSTALIGFFTMYMSPFGGVGRALAASEEIRQLEEVLGIASVLVFNALLVGALLFALRRWRPPFGFGALLFGGLAFGMTGLDGFARVELVLPATLAGFVVDTLIGRDWPASGVVAMGSFVLWAGYFGVAELSYGLSWTVELWAGSIVLAVASSVLFSSLMFPASPPPARDSRNE